MARRAIDPALQATLSLEALVAPPASSKRASPAARGSRALANARAEVEAMVRQARGGDFSSAQVKHAVALHAFLHHAVTGVEDAELEGEAFLGACSAAGKLCRDAFVDQVPDLVEYVRWAWARERRREAKRRSEQDQDGRRLGWRLLFGGRGLLTDYRVAQHRVTPATTR